MKELSHTQTWDFVRLAMRLSRTGRSSTRAVLEQCPACHFFMLERLHMVIENQGQDGAIYMGDLAAMLHTSPQAVSRSIRVLEADGLAERMPDPADRRRTLVRLTPKGDADRRVCEKALHTFLDDVWERMGPDHAGALLREAALLERTMAELAPGPSEPEAAPAPQSRPRHR